MIRNASPSAGGSLSVWASLSGFSSVLIFGVSDFGTRSSNAGARSDSRERLPNRGELGGDSSTPDLSGFVRLIVRYFASGISKTLVKSETVKENGIRRLRTKFFRISTLCWCLSASLLSVSKSTRIKL